MSFSKMMKPEVYKNLVEKLNLCAIGAVTQLPKEMKEFKLGGTYRNGAKGAPNRSEDPENPLFYEGPGIPKLDDADRKYPIGPFKTGVNGRGQHFLEGANECSDLYVKYKFNGKTFGCLIKRKKEKTLKYFAFPGGNKDDADDGVGETAIREFFEEMFSNASLEDVVEICEMLSTGKIRLVKKSVMDDARITDNSWIESNIFEIEISGEGAEKMMKRLNELLTPCPTETLGAEIVEITTEFIKESVWGTHELAVQEIYESDVVPSL